MHIARLVVGKILPAVQGGQRPGRKLPEQREMEVVDMEMHHVEFIGTLACLVEHQHEMRNGIPDHEIESQSLWRAGDEIGDVTESALANSVT
jgi:hypothetical protein